MRAEPTIAIFLSSLTEVSVLPDRCNIVPSPLWGEGQGEGLPGEGHVAPSSGATRHLLPKGAKGRCSAVATKVITPFHPSVPSSAHRGTARSRYPESPRYRRGRRWRR